MFHHYGTWGVRALSAASAHAPPGPGGKTRVLTLLERARLQPRRSAAKTIGALRLRKNSGFVSGYRFSDTASSSETDAPLGAGHRHLTFSAASLAADSDCGALQ